MRIIYCDSGFSPEEIDYMYAEEYEAAKSKFIQTSLMSFEELKRGNVEHALKRVRKNEEKEIGIYRGWMLKPSQYEMLYNSLLEKNIQLINDPVEYKFCHYLPESYETIKDYTPKTTFKELNAEFRMDDFQNEIGAFGDKPIVVKDYVKSQKHYWEEACFIPNAAKKEKVNLVVNKFLELQDNDLNEGLVFREFIELEELSNHSESGMPLTKEFRIFVKNGQIMTVFKYWDEGDYQDADPVVDEFEEVIPKIKSNFFTMDIAKKKDGNWIIVELGDGQVAGLPDNADKDEFYNELKK
ncbi:MAG: ATP-grasp domain-containing protein [Bacteroidota bacterium]